MIAASAKPGERPNRPLDYYPHIEGLRGVAALYVVLYHVWQNGLASRTETFGSFLPAATSIFAYGHYAVAVFIVISGYCLGLPVVRKAQQPFDRVRFAKRRARRLLPAYLLVLFLSLIPFVATHRLRGDHIPLSHIAASLLAHLFLVHNLFRDAALSINAPMWSIALESQIYVAFALVLVPLWRRFGWATQLGVALALGVAPHFLLHGDFDWTAPWMLGLFGMGFAAASVRGTAFTRWFALAAGIAALAALRPSSGPSGYDWAKDSLVGVAVALFLVSSAAPRTQTIAARILAVPPLVALGTFSYSLYLVHGPLVALACAALIRYDVGPVASGCAYLALIVVAVVVAYGVYRIAERPFMSGALRASNDRAVHAHEHAEVPAAAEVAPERAARVPSLR